MEDLPTSYDVIVVGTGMPECILAAAVARVGKTVLHIDRHSYYGGDWASFNFDQIQKWMEKNKSYDQNTLPIQGNIDPSWSELIAEGEELIACPETFPFITNIKEKINVRKRQEVLDEQQQGSIVNENVEIVSVGVTSENPQNHAVDKPVPEVHNTGEEIVQESVCKADGCSDEVSDVDAGTSACDPQATVDSVPTVSVVGSGQEVSHEGTVVYNAASIPSSGTESEMISVLESGSDESAASCNDAAGSCDGENSPNVCDKENDVTPSKKEWTLEDLQSQHRKFNLDLAPKLLFARGPLVELLISSNIARYAEFKCFTRVLTSINGHLEQVPCSRADVFSTKNVSVVEKRMLMKLLTFCLEYQKHPDEYRGFEGRPFLRFLRSKKLTPNIEHYVLHAIAMVDESTPTLQGLQATQKFLESLGRYGNSPFLWTCYGSAELPQCFCRLCAVFGGIYYLNRRPEAIVLDSERKCRGIISSGQKLSCEWLVMESSYTPLCFIPQETAERVSHAILITDNTLLPAEKEQLTLLRLPPLPGVRGAITIFELGPAAYVCPDGLYVVHMACRSSAASAYEDLKSAIQELFLSFEEDKENQEQEDTEKPKVLWSLFYNQKDTSVLDLNSQVPPGLLLTSSPELEQDYNAAVKEAQKLFQDICPGEEFLPRAPDPEDIVLEDHSNPNPGETGEDHLPEGDDDKDEEIPGVNEELEGDKSLESEVELNKIPEACDSEMNIET